MSGSGAIVTCAGVSKTYGEGVARVEALKGASFAVGRGEQVAVCGPSGSGKSTLMNVLGLLDVPTEGSYELLGIDVSALGEPGRAGLRSRVIGFVFQSFHLLGARSAAENVELALLYSAVPRRHRSAVARETLARVGLAHRADADVTTLSGGERQRVAIARAIAHGPELLLADEPTGNLDTATSDQVLSVLDDLNTGDGLTQIVVTHSEALAARIGRRLDVLDGVVTDSAGVAAAGRADGG
ncbi:MAG: ABC transporter ATP-binding protein [Acidimicrobiales bacterium]|nr:ABC transporter ATP-binding protein [Acidimicrobiales bacterium]